MWFYERALDEDLLLTLLQIEPLFDLAMLKRLFRNEDRNRGAGPCSSNLLEAVVTLVEKMEKKAMQSDDTYETFPFDAKEILQQQHQPKFCMSVNVVVKPYYGSHRHAHMAHHFREVLPILTRLI